MREAKCNGENFAVSDENGYYVAYYDYLQEAQAHVREGDKDLEMDGKEGSYAVMERVEDEDGYHYELM